MQMKARKVVTRSGRGFRGYFPSKKLNRMVEWESILERDAIYLFEHSPGVVSYQEQPSLVYYEIDGEMRKYFPDFELVLANGELVHVEVKPEAMLSSEKLSMKLTAIAQAYASRQFTFRVLTDTEIRREPRLHNLKLLSRFKAHTTDNQIDQQKAELIMSANQEVTVSELYEALGQSNTLKLIADQFLQCDLEQSFESKNNFAVLVKEADHDALYL
jgi:hypothetical protein